MLLKNKLYIHQGGGVLILVALMTPLLLTIVGITVDLGKVYAVRSKAQNALDAAVLGAASQLTSGNYQSFARNVFDANFPASYMGSTASSFSVTLNSGTFTGQVRIRMPWSIMQAFGMSEANFLSSAIFIILIFLKVCVNPFAPASY